MDNRRTTPQRLTSGLNAHGISLSRDGSAARLFLVRAERQHLVGRDPGSGVASVADAQQVTFGNEKIEKLAVSPDGRWLAYDSDRNGQADIWKQPLPAVVRSR